MNLKHIQHGQHLPHVECPNRILPFSMHAATQSMVTDILMIQTEKHNAHQAAVTPAGYRTKLTDSAF
jgi:hypothetical protein